MGAVSSRNTTEAREQRSVEKSKVEQNVLQHKPARRKEEEVLTSRVVSGKLVGLHSTAARGLHQWHKWHHAWSQYPQPARQGWAGRPPQVIVPMVLYYMTNIANFSLSSQ